jgi:Flp pilus assembly protein TadG
MILRLLRDCGGNVAIMFSLSLPLLIGGLSLGVESGYWYFRQASLQGAVDAAAYAAALEARAGSDSATILAAAKKAASSNGYVVATGTISITGPYASGSGWAVKVVLQRAEKRYFSQIFYDKTITTAAKAIASYTTAANACVLALDKSASQAVLFSGNSNLSLTGCNVMSNSIAADSVASQGSAAVTAPCIMAAGGTSLTTNVTLTSCTSPMTQLPQAADPYKSVPPPTASGNCKNSNGNTLQPGNYCSGLNLSGTVNLNPGVYYVSGDVKINANANIHGSGVTIYLAGSSSVTMNGNATVTLSAPTTGTYSGILFYGDPNGSSSVVEKFNGTAASLLTGAIYFPNQEVDYLGNFSGAGGCTQVVARKVQWTGNAHVAVNCSAYGMQAVPVSSVVKLSG